MIVLVAIAPYKTWILKYNNAVYMSQSCSSLEYIAISNITSFKKSLAFLQLYRGLIYLSLAFATYSTVACLCDLHSTVAGQI